MKCSVGLLVAAARFHRRDLPRQRLNLWLWNFGRFAISSFKVWQFERQEFDCSSFWLSTRFNAWARTPSTGLGQSWNDVQCQLLVKHYQHCKGSGMKYEADTRSGRNLPGLGRQACSADSLVSHHDMGHNFGVWRSLLKALRRDIIKRTFKRQKIFLKSNFQFSFFPWSYLWSFTVRLIDSMTFMATFPGVQFFPKCQFSFLGILAQGFMFD